MLLTVKFTRKITDKDRQLAVDHFFDFIPSNENNVLGQLDIKTVNEFLEIFNIWPTYSIVSDGLNSIILKGITL